MSVKMKPTSVIKARLGIEPKGPVHQWLTNTVALHMDKYVPWDTGALAETVVVNGVINKANVTEDTIHYDQPYAIYVYKGVRNGKDMHYQTDMHTLAGPYWDKRMWSAEKHQVIKEVQNYFNKYGGRYG